MLISRVLRQSSLAQDLGDERLARLVTLAREEDYPAEATIFEEGDDLLDLYVVGKGTVAVMMEARLWKTASPLKTGVAIVGPGGTFGWSAIVEPHAATLTAKAREQSTVVTINGEELNTLMDDDPVIGYCVMSALVKLVSIRLDATRRSLMSGRGLDLERKPVLMR